MVVAPSSSAIWSTSAVNSRSARVASMGENSTSSQCSRACATAARAWPFTSARLDWSWCSMWMSLVEMNVWMRGRSESLIAFQAASTSCALARARPQMTGPCTSRAIACTASKSPGELIGKPASMMSTPRRASCCAISSFSCLLSEIPGDCSPSRRVVSKIFTRSDSLRSTSCSCSLLLPGSPWACGWRPPRVIPPEGGEEGEGAGRPGTTWREKRTGSSARPAVADDLAAGHPVAAAHERSIAPGAAAHDVAVRYPVGAEAGGDLITSRAAAQVVIADAPHEEVLTRPALHGLVAEDAPQLVVARAAGHQRPVAEATQLVVARAAEDAGAVGDAAVVAGPEQQRADPREAAVS